MGHDDNLSGRPKKASPGSPAAVPASAARWRWTWRGGLHRRRHRARARSDRRPDRRGKRVRRLHPPFPCDVTDEAGMARTVDRIEPKPGRSCSRSSTPATICRRPWRDCRRNFRKTYEVNVFGVSTAWCRWSSACGARARPDRADWLGHRLFRLADHWPPMAPPRRR